MEKSPLKIAPEELDAFFGKPKNQPIIVHVLAAMGNLHHDRVTIELINERNERLLLPFSQEALRELLAVAGEQSTGPTRPKAN